MFLAWRDLRVARGRFVLVGVVIALVALLTTLLSGLASGLVDDGISGLRSLPLTHLALQPGAQHSFSRSSLDDTNLQPWRDAAATDGFEVAPLGASFFNARTSDGDTVDIALFGTPADSFLLPEGAAREALAGPPGLVLSEELGESAGLEVGDELTIVGPDVTLPILAFTDSGSYGHVEIAFSTLAEWQQLVYGSEAKGRFSAVAIRDTNGDAASQLAAIDERAGTVSETRESAYAGSPGYSAETATMSLISGFLLVISALIVAAFFTVWTIQRTRQIGLLKALGASNLYILRDALGQLAVVLVASTAVGAAVAIGLGQLVGSDVPFSLEAGPILTSTITLVVLGMLGALVAIRRVTAVDPIISLAGAEQ